MIGLQAEKIILSQEHINDDGNEEVQEDLGYYDLVQDEEDWGHVCVATLIAYSSIKEQLFIGLTWHALEIDRLLS